MSLPWNEVNCAAPSRVAEILELPKSPVGGRKLYCPFCGGRNLAPLKRAFFCYSGCGGKAYSNVDTASRHWGVPPAHACRDLARELDIACADDPPPWRQVAEYSADEVGHVLALRPAEERWMWHCPSCGGAGTLRSYRQRWRCSAEPCKTVQEGWKEHVDVAMAVWNTGPLDACFRLHRLLTGNSQHTRDEIRADPAFPSAEEPTERDTALASVLARPGANPPEAVYRAILAHLRLGPLGRAELQRRRVDVEAAHAFGFRSTEPGEWETRVLPLMAAFADDELTAAGFPRGSAAEKPRSRPWWPGWGRAPLLVIPIWDGLRLSSLRFRNLGDPVATRCPRYNSPKGAPPDAPLRADALDRTTRALHIVEGDLNGYVVAAEPYRGNATGLAGAWTWDDAWAARVPDDVDYVVGWFDTDTAGIKGAAKVRDSFARMRGLDWARRRWRRLLLFEDACELHRTYRLSRLLVQAPWVSQALEPLWDDSDKTTAGLMAMPPPIDRVWI